MMAILRHTVRTLAQSMRAFIVGATISLFVLSCASAPSDQEPRLEVVNEVGRVSCRLGGVEGPARARRVQSQPLVAAAGGYRAAVEVESLPLEGNGAVACRNVSKLLVAAPGGELRTVFTQNPGAEGKVGNALSLVDWSPDGTRLLVELDTWTYLTDPVDPLVLVWDATTQRVEQLELRHAFEQRFGEDCHFRLEPAGFTAQGEVVVKLLAPVSSPKPACVPDGELWVRSDDSAASLEPLPRNVKVRRYARGS